MPQVSFENQYDIKFVSMCGNNDIKKGVKHE